MRTIIKLFLFLFISLFIFGCGAGKTLVMEPTQTKSNVNSVKIEQLQPTCDVPNEVSVKFNDLLNEKLYTAERFHKGDELTLKYRFLQLDKGNQFERWFWGGIGNAGEGTLTIEATFEDINGKTISKIQSEGKIGSGFFGGDFSLALNKAADEIVEYAVANFK